MWLLINRDKKVWSTREVMKKTLVFGWETCSSQDQDQGLHVG